MKNIVLALLALFALMRIASATRIVEQPHEEYLKGAPVEWYFPISPSRAYVERFPTRPDLDTIYVNQDAYFFSDRDRDMLIRHEQYHIDNPGAGDQLFGIGSGLGIVRYLTTWD